MFYNYFLKIIKHLQWQNLDFFLFHGFSLERWLGVCSISSFSWGFNVLLHQTITYYNRDNSQVLHILLVTSVTFYFKYTLCCILTLVFSLLSSSLLVIFETFDFKRMLKLDHARVFYNFKTHNTTRSSLALFSIH